MKFVDNISLEVSAGNGGNGVISFLRELHRPLGGPDGGNGGNGGNIYFQGDHNLNTLAFLINHKKLLAGNGGNGAGNNCQGTKGKDLIVKVPLGTIIKTENHELICNIDIDKKNYLIAQGGKGGKGNAAFKTKNVKAPKICENGSAGEYKKLELELKLLANVGVIGYPNAGKSTLVSVVSAAKPKIGNFAFTSLNPTLGIVKNKLFNTFVIADIPGLIEGSSKGKGLGHQFLKHVEKCETLIHLLNAEEIQPSKIFKQYENINNELSIFSNILHQKPQIITLNKIELLSSKQLNTIINYFAKKNLEILTISALQKTNLDKLISKCFINIKNYHLNNILVKDSDIKSISAKDVFVPNDINIICKKNIWFVQSTKAEILVNKIPLLNKDCYTLLNKKLEKIGIFAELKKHNIKDGDEIDIYGYTFEWRDKK